MRMVEVRGYSDGCKGVAFDEVVCIVFMSMVFVSGSGENARLSLCGRGGISLLHLPKNLRAHFQNGLKAHASLLCILSKTLHTPLLDLVTNPGESSVCRDLCTLGEQGFPCRVIGVRTVDHGLLYAHNVASSQVYRPQGNGL